MAATFLWTEVCVCVLGGLSSAPEYLSQTQASMAEVTLKGKEGAGV